MKHQYHVYASPKDGITNTQLIEQIHAFLGKHVSEGLADRYFIQEFTSTGSFSELPQFHITVDYPSEEAMSLGMVAVKKTYKQAPHSPLMTMVKDFKVAFSKAHEN